MRLGAHPCRIPLVEQELTERLTNALGAPGDPWDTAVRALNVFLDECTDVAYQRIVLQEGPVALGWARWRELDERHMVGLIRDLVDELISAGVFRPPVVPAHRSRGLRADHRIGLEPRRIERRAGAP